MGAGPVDQGHRPTLFACIPKKAARERTVREGLHQLQWVCDIQGDLPEQAFCEFFLIWDLVEDSQVTPGLPDQHIWVPSAAGVFSSKSAYERFFVGAIGFDPARRLWNSWVLPRCKFFIWLASLNRCWTADRLAKRGLEHPDSCLLCDQESETVQHLLASCVFSREAWFRILSWVGLQHLAPTQQDSVFQDWWRAALKRTPKPVRKGFNSLVILVAWMLWKLRNACVFEGAAPDMNKLLQAVRDEAALWGLAGASKLRALMAEA